jgi:hypothetical protein
MNTLKSMLAAVAVLGLISGTTLFANEEKKDAAVTTEATTTETTTTEKTDKKAKKSKKDHKKEDKKAH